MRIVSFVLGRGKILRDKKIIIIAVGLGVGWFIVTRILSTTTQKIQYQTAQVEQGSIIATVSESGNVTAGSQVNVNSPTNGVIEEIYVKNGDSVTLGDNLFKVKSTATPQEQASAYASYLSAQNSLNSAQAKMNSLQSALFKANQTFVNDRGIQNPITDDPKYIQERADWLQSEADYKNQASVIAQTQAAFNSAALVYQATQDSVVTAPASGTVANLSAIIGTTVTASSNSNSSSSTTTTSSTPPVLILGNFSDLSIKSQVSEVDISKIHTGEKATITLDAFPDKTFVGLVNSLDTVGTSTSGVVTYNVYITFVAPPSDIHPGMTASVIIQTDRRDNVLIVPSSSVQTSNGETTVRVLKNGQVTQVPVAIGISSDTDTEINSGVSVGDTVVTSIATQTTTTGGQSASPFSGGLRFGGGFGGGARGNNGR